MISKQKEIIYGDNGIAYTKYSFYGLSTDEKPVFTEMGNGSMFIEMDTGKGYMFDKANELWREV